MDICICCYYNSDLYELRKCISSLFINLNNEEIFKEYRTGNKMFNDVIRKKITENGIKDIKFLNLCCGAFINRFYSSNNKFNTIQEYINDAINNYNFLPLNKIRNKFNIILQVDGLGDKLYPSFDYFYDKLDFHNFMKIMEWKYGINKTEYLNKFNVRVNIKDEKGVVRNKIIRDFTKNIEFFNYNNCKNNNEFRSIAKEYYTQIIENKENDNSLFVKNITELYRELKEICSKYNIKVMLRGSKYHTSLTIGRNYCMTHSNGNWIKFIDDDDMSCSLNILDKIFDIIKKNKLSKSKIYMFNAFNLGNFQTAYIHIFMQLIIGPNIHHPYTKIKYMNGEDYVFVQKHKDIIKQYFIDFPIYYRFKSSYKCGTFDGLGRDIIDKNYFDDVKTETPEFFGFEWKDEFEFISIE